MAELTLKNVAGNDAGKVELDAEVFGLEPNVPVMHQVVTAQLAARRSGTQSTKTRSEVRGGGKKPWAQKGTGNARQGSIRSPQWRGGGIALGPKPRKYDQKTPKKMVKLATRSALSDRASEGKVVVVDSWNFDTPKTKSAKQALDALDVAGNVLVVLSQDDDNALLSFRNLVNVQVIAASELNAYDVLCSDWVVFTKASLPTGAALGDASPAAPAPANEAEAASTTDAADQAGPQGKGSHAANDDDSEPEGFPIKGNADSMLFHTPDSPFYKNTIAEVWFATEDAAEAAGFSKPESQKKAEEEASEEGEDA